MKPLVTLRTVPRTVVVGALCVAGFLVMVVGGSLTEALFSRVGYPGAGWGGVPVTFDLAGKRAALDQLAAKGTLDLFGWVQIVDITIIVGTLFFFTALGVLAWRAQPAGGWFDRLGRCTTAAFVLAPTADAVENLTALVLITGRPRPLTVLSLANSPWLRPSCSSAVGRDSPCYCWPPRGGRRQGSPSEGYGWPKSAPPGAAAGGRRLTGTL